MELWFGWFFLFNCFLGDPCFNDFAHIPWEDTPKLPQPPHKNRKFQNINSWWNILLVSSRDMWVGIFRMLIFRDVTNQNIRCWAACGHKTAQPLDHHDTSPHGYRPHWPWSRPPRGKPTEVSWLVNWGHPNLIKLVGGFNPSQKS